MTTKTTTRIRTPCCFWRHQRSSDWLTGWRIGPTRVVSLGALVAQWVLCSGSSRAPAYLALSE